MWWGGEDPVIGILFLHFLLPPLPILILVVVRTVLRSTMEEETSTGFRWLNWLMVDKVANNNQLRADLLTLVQIQIVYPLTGRELMCP